MLPTLSLSQRINTSTRLLHSHLNALILSLLPLALPPHASDPRLYATGIAHIVPIYEAFEEVLRLLLAPAEADEYKGEENSHWEAKRNGQSQNPNSPELLEALSKLYIPDLERTTRLQHDISTLSQPPHPPHPNPSLTALTTHIHATLPTHPHLLLAYTWLLYMALFAGGRYIRCKLTQAGAAFWLLHLIHSNPEKQGDGLSFWTFSGDAADGEDIKGEFKRRFAEVEGWLTEGEREEVVREAVFVMGAMVGVVGGIAGSVGKGGCAGRVGLGMRKEEAKEEGKEEGEGPSMQWLLFKHVLPMGMVELLSGAAKVVMLGIGRSCKASGNGKV